MSVPQSNAPSKDAENYPIKKRFRESTTSRDNLDCTILSGVKQALAEQSAELKHIVTTQLLHLAKSPASASKSLANHKQGAIPLSSQSDMKKTRSVL